MAKVKMQSVPLREECEGVKTTGVDLHPVAKEQLNELSKALGNRQYPKYWVVSIAIMHLSKAVKERKIQKGQDLLKELGLV